MEVKVYVKTDKEPAKNIKNIENPNNTDMI
jgi:hypothetical protein